MRRVKRKFIYYILISLSYVFILTCNLEAATLTVGSASGSPGEKDIPIPINLNSTPSEEVCSFNFDLRFDASRISFKEVTLGPKAKEAGKSLSFSQPHFDIVRIMVVGFNQNKIENGTVLNLTFDILNTAPSGKAELIITDPAISDCSPQADPLPVTTEDGGIIVEGNPTDSTTTTSTNSPTTIITTTSTTIRPLPDTTTTTSTTDMSTSSTTSINSTSSSTTSSVLQFWPLLYDEMWGNKKDQNLFLLRDFRRVILINTEVGREYVFILYDNSFEIAVLLLQDPSLTELASEVANGILLSMESLVYNDEMIMDQKTIDDFESLLNHFESKASPKLKFVIKKIKKDINDEMIFNQLGITVFEY